MSRHIWKSVIASVLIGLIICTPPVVNAENRTAKEYMAEGIREAYDNMHLIYRAYYDDEGNLETQPARHVAIWQEWDDDWNLVSRTYLGADGEQVNIADGYSKAEWRTSDNGIRKIGFYDTEGKQLEGIHILWNVEFGEEDGWSEWMEPKMEEQMVYENKKDRRYAI